jgi:hypothetical protein
MTAGILIQDVGGHRPPLQCLLACFQFDSIPQFSRIVSLSCSSSTLITGSFFSEQDEIVAPLPRYCSKPLR